MFCSSTTSSGSVGDATEVGQRADKQVFATPVMVTVARNLEAPIKLVAPRPSSSGVDFAMLGLGDVVVPGLMVALCLRYDLARYTEKRTDEDVSPRSAFGKSYFLVALVSYLAGLAITIAVMSWTGKAQPALLYLSPACSESARPFG